MIKLQVRIIITAKLTHFTFLWGNFLINFQLFNTNKTFKGHTSKKIQIIKNIPINIWLPFVSTAFTAVREFDIDNPPPTPLPKQLITTLQQWTVTPRPHHICQYMHAGLNVCFTSFGMLRSRILKTIYLCEVILALNRSGISSQSCANFVLRPISAPLRPILEISAPLRPILKSLKCAQDSPPMPSLLLKVK